MSPGPQHAPDADREPAATPGAAPDAPTPPVDLDAWRARSRPERLAANLARLDERVLGWDALRAEPYDVDSRRHRPLLFLHMPRTGGTTLEAVVARNYPANLMLHVNAPDVLRHPDALFKLWAPHAATGRARRAFAVLGHHKIDDPLYQYPAVPFVHVTLLRDPVARVISHYKDLTRHERQSRDAGHHDADALLAFLDANERLECWNAQTLRLAGRLDRRTLRDPPDDAGMAELLAAAQDNLARRFSFFGLTDGLSAFLLVCRRLLGWREILCWPRNVLERSALDQRVDDALGDEVAQRLAAMNTWDARLLEFARALAAARLAALGIGPAEVARLDEAQRRYRDLATVGIDGPTVSAAADDTPAPDRREGSP